MADLRIVDAPEIPTENITGEEKLPTGGNGNYSISLDSLADYTKTKKDLADNTSVDGKVNGVRQELDAHIEDLLNPHQVTKGQIGLGNVDNTADLDKPVSNSTQAAIISAVAPKADKSSVYTKSETYSRQETQGLVDDKISTALAPVSSEIDYIERYTPLPYKLQNYSVGQRVTLSTGEIVENIVPNNNVDPNTDMLGWVKVNSADQIFDESGLSQQQVNNGVESIAELLAIPNPKDGSRVYVKSYYKADNFALLKPYSGGGTYVYSSEKVSKSDDISNIGGWLLQYENTLNLKQCGLKGDGVADDRPALQKAVRVASKLKVKLIGSAFDVYLIASSQTVESRVDLIFCNTNYLDIDLNGATIKIANSLGDYRTIFGAGWVHSHFRITNGVIDQNTTGNPPQSPVLWSNTNGQRCIVSAFSVPHEYFEVTNVKMLDALGVWEINTTQAKRVNICDNEIYYSAVNTPHTDKTSIYVLPRQWGKVNNNKFYGDTFGNATTAVEIHGSNCEFIGNTVVGFRSPVFITPNAQEPNSAVYRNVYVRDNNFMSCQNGVLIWVESAAELNRPMENVHITGNKILIDSRLTTNTDIGLINGIGVGFLGSDEDCVIDGLYIQNNKINYNYNSENLKKSTRAGIDLTSSIPNAAFEWSNIYVQDNIIEYAPCNGIAIGNKVVGPHTSSIANVLMSGNNVLNCGAGQVSGNNSAVKVHNPSKLSKIRVKDNTFSETEDGGVTFMRFVSVDAGDNSAVSGVRIYDNETSFSRNVAVNDMYDVKDILINDLRKNHLNHLDTNTKAKYGSKFRSLISGKTIVQSSLDANTPIWKEVTY